MTTRDYDCDCLVVGSGPGGAMTAMILAEAGRDVLLLEEGRDDLPETKPYGLDEMNRYYRHKGMGMALGHPKMAYLEACCLGGASEVNAGLYHRPATEILQRWADEYAINGFGVHELEPFFKHNEELLMVHPMPEGIGPASRILMHGAGVLGWKAQEIPRMWEDAPGGGEGRRRSMRRSVLPKAKAAGARVMANVKVTKIIFQGRRAVMAMACVTQDKRSCIRIRFNNIFVCAGAIQSPALLLRSGVGGPVGARLKFHPAVRLVARFETKASDIHEGVPTVQVTEFKPELTLGGAFSSPAYLALWLAGRKDMRHMMQNAGQLAIFYALVRAKGYARIRLQPVTGDVLVFSHLNDADFVALGDGIHKLGRLLFAAGAKEIYSPIVDGESYYAADQMDFLTQGILPEQVDLSTIHLFASCPMGERRATCVVDSYGRVHGKDNVYVNDASILPDAPGSNPQALIMALARRNAQHFCRVESNV